MELASLTVVSQSYLGVRPTPTPHPPPPRLETLDTVSLTAILGTLRVTGGLFGLVTSQESGGTETFPYT